MNNKERNANKKTKGNKGTEHDNMEHNKEKKKRQ